VVAQSLRLVLAIVSGVLTAIVLAYAATVVVVLATVGIPLGAASRPLSGTQATLLLAGAATAAFIGGRLARRIARGAGTGLQIALPVLLGALMLWGFSGRNAWPDWWGPAAAALTAFGAWLGARPRA